ncbi:MAG: hypothetical protein Q9184_007288 [Pyrenodesmia sp. 2 TL-2023]
MSSSHYRPGGARGESSTTNRTQISYKNEPSRVEAPRWGESRRGQESRWGDESRRGESRREDSRHEESRRGDSRRSTTILDSRHADNNRQTGYPRVQTIYEEEEKKTVTRNNRIMIPYGKESTMTRTEKTVTRDGRALVPYNNERTVTRNEKTVTRDTRVQTIRDDERAATRTKLSASSSRNSSAPSNRTELERRVERLEDEKTRRLERQVEKLSDQVAQLQMEKGKQRQFVFQESIVDVK